jgi:molybdate transport system ATP-binding protein
VTLHARVRTQLGSLHLECDLSVDAGVTVAVLGPNGAGKTTLLRVVAGLVPLDEGRVECDGALFQDTTTGAWLTPEARRVGFVFQDHGLFPHLSVLDNVAFGLRARGVHRQLANAKAREWLERVDLANYATSRPSTLSGGQSQRAALARVLVTDPQALLLDEPLSAVDASGRLELRRALREYLAAFTGVRLIVTHDPLEAASLAERVIVLEDGRITQDGSFGEVSARPRSDWIARMAGLTLLRGAVSDSTILLDDGSRLTVATDVRGSALAGGQPAQRPALHGRRDRSGR